MIVQGRGPKPARLMVVGQTPGEWEAQTGVPFYPRAAVGRELTRYLHQTVRVNREEVFLTNLIQEYLGDADVTAAHVKKWESKLLSDLVDVRPEVIITLGREATRWFLGDVNLEEVYALPHLWSRPDNSGVAVIVPNYLRLYDSDLQPLIWYGFEMARRVLKGETDCFKPAPDDRRIEYSEYKNAAPIPFWGMSDHVAVDTEGLEGNAWGLSFSVSIGMARVVKKANIRSVRDLTKKRLIMHNSLHDIAILRELGIEVHRFEDTMVMAFLLCLEPQGLKQLAYRYRGLKRQSYDEVIEPASFNLAVNWLLKAACVDWGPPEEELVFEDGKVRIRKPWSINRRLDGIIGILEGEIVIHDEPPPELARRKAMTAAKKWLEEQGVKVGKYNAEKTGWIDCRIPNLSLPLVHTNPLFCLGHIAAKIPAGNPRERWAALERDMPDTTDRIEQTLGPMPEAGLDDLEKFYGPEGARKAIEYSAGDADDTWTIYPILKKRIEELDLTAVYELDLSVIPMLDRMMHVGFAADKEYFQKLGVELTSEMEKDRDEIERLVGARINPNSSTQVASLLFDKLGMPVQQYTATKQPSTADEVIEALRLIDDHPVLPLISDYRELSKMRGTYADKLWRWLKADGRIHPKLRITRVPSGRLCVAKGTLVEILRDVKKYPKGVPIEDVRAGDLAYTYDARNRLRIQPVVWAGSTGQKRVMRIHWLGTGRRHSGYVDVTPEHQVRLSDGSYRKAQDLAPGDSLSALSRGVRNGYGRLWALGREITREHRYVWEQLFGHPGAAADIHHIDGNKLHNTPQNLQLLSRSEHAKLHAAQITPELRRKRSEVMKQRWPEMRAKLVHIADQNPRWLGLTKKWLLQVLRASGGRPTAFRDVYGIDYKTATKYLVMHGIDWRSVRAEYSKDPRGRMQRKYNHVVDRIEMLDGLVDVYDLEVQATHNFIGNEIALHNSCSEPNLMAIPVRSQRLLGGEKLGKRIRDGFKARPGCVLGSWDLDQIEMRVLAHRSEDPRLVGVFHSGEDIHQKTASLVFGLPMEQVGKGTWQRDSAKNVGFGIVYGISPTGLQLQLKLRGIDRTEAECEEMIDAYLVKAYPGVRSLMEERKAEARRYGYVRSMLGRIRYLPGIHSSNPKLRSEAERISLNHDIQTSAQEIEKLGMAGVWTRVLPAIRQQGYTCEPILQVHDELILELDEKIAPELDILIRNEMQEAVKLIVPIGAKGNYALSWGGLK